jgi:hypothetical protein
MNVEIKLIQFFSVPPNQEQEIDDRYTFLFPLILTHSSRLTSHILLVAGSSGLWNSQCFEDI